MRTFEDFVRSLPEPVYGVELDRLRLCWEEAQKAVWAMPKMQSPCLRKAAEDEPLFVVRAQDATFHLVVLYWLVLNGHIRPDPYGAQVTRYGTKWSAAQMLIQQAVNWQAANKTKAAD